MPAGERQWKEECEAAPSFRPPGAAGEPRRILRRGSDRGKVAALPATVAFSRNERREGREGRSCCGEESTVRRRGAVLWSSENERRRGRG
ncbi:hypothetical protein JCGZ_25864 [Jatropha curcas]|uniref:Uncharacterized protein n=1 Tax=Jatropha curcas TaxID=180498 RepID=A0A067JK28_JATCU|nr:hypothetical protein JCGZ_25864 [Jatropha curcas]